MTEIKSAAIYCRLARQPAGQFGNRIADRTAIQARCYRDRRMGVGLRASSRVSRAAGFAGMVCGDRYAGRAIRKKSEKKYRSPCLLITYLNINEYDVRQREIEQAIAGIKARYSKEFIAIYVLWKRQLY